MNRLRIATLSIIVLILLINKSFALSKPDNLLTGSYFYQVYDLSQKSYYEQIFTKDERKELKKADKYLVSARKYMDSYLSDQKEIEKLYTIAEATSSAKSREKSLKKARKLEASALKDGFKAIEYYKKSNEIKSKIYTNALGRARLNDDSKLAKAGREMELQAKSLFDQAATKERTAPQHDEQQKFNALKEANDLYLKALDNQEKAFAIYKNDPSVQTDVPTNNVTNNQVKPNNQVVKKDTAIFPVYVEQYNPLKDENLYQSKANMILPKLNLTNEELNSFAESNRKNQTANDLLRQVDEAYIVVDSLNYMADKATDKALQDRLRSEAIDKENTAFYKLTTATNQYIDVNETRYKIYKNHYPVIDQKKLTPETERAKNYTQEAEDYYLKAKSDISSASRLMYKSDQYLKLMGANDLLLYALQLQENAYGIYLNMPGLTSTEIDTAFVERTKINNSTKPVKQENVSNKLSWEVLSTYNYSKDKPKPVVYQVKKGVVFLVQLGIFKGMLPPEKFGTVQPVVFDNFVKNPYRRYIVGEYRTSEAAELALEKVKALGYTDSYIISMIDGQRKSFSTGSEKLNNNEENYKFLRRTELAKINGESIIVAQNDNAIIDDSPKTGIVPENKIQKSSGLIYLVQIGMYMKPVQWSELGNLSPIYTDKIPDKGTRYMLGTFNSVEKAREASQKVISKGFKDAYVIAYSNGEHIKLDKAIELEKKGKVSVEQKITSEIKFMVQVGAYRENLDNSEENQLIKSFSPRTVDKNNYGDMNIYTIGNFTSYKEADALRKKLLEEGHKDVFVVAYEGKNKIHIADAIKKTKN